VQIDRREHGYVGEPKKEVSANRRQWQSFSCSTLPDKLSPFIITAVLRTPQRCQNLIRITSPAAGLLDDKSIKSRYQIRFSRVPLYQKTMPLVLYPLDRCWRTDVQLKENTALLITDAGCHPHFAILRISGTPLQKLGGIEIQARHFHADRII
jgi:hypothetical protein